MKIVSDQKHTKEHVTTASFNAKTVIHHNKYYVLTLS